MTQFKADSSVLRVAKNACYVVLKFGVYIASGIILIPYLMKNYGPASYGLIALAGFLTQYVGMISGCVGIAVARYLNVALNQNDWKQANEIFNTAIIANLGFISLQIPLFILGVWKLDVLIDFPPEIATDFRILVTCNIIIFFLNIIRGIIFTPIQAANRLDIGAKFQIGYQLLRLVFIFLLVSQIGAKLWILGAVDLALSIVTFLVGISIYRKLVDRKLIFSFRFLSKKWIRPVLSMAGWSLVSTLGFSLFVKTDVLIINRLVSKEMAGVYAALLVWPNLIKQAGGVVGQLVAPVFTIDFARGNMERLRQTCMFSSQFLSYFAACAAGVFIIAAPGLIELWLDASYVKYAFWVQLLVGQLVLTASGSVIWNIFVTVGKTQYMGIGNLVPGILNIVLSLLFVFMGMGALGVLYGSLIAIMLKENILFPVWVAKETGLKYRQFLMMYLRSSAVFLVVMAIGRLVWNQELPFSFIRFAVMVVLGGVGALVTISMISFRVEREMVIHLIRTHILKRKTAE